MKYNKNKKTFDDVEKNPNLIRNKSYRQIIESYRNLQFNPDSTNKNKEEFLAEKKEIIN